MSKKRSLVDAAIALARCSDIFTQDLDEDHLKDQIETPPPVQPKPASTPSPTPPRNGVTVWTLDEAIAKCKEAGISREELMAHLRQTGASTYKKQAHTALVEAMILAKRTGAKPVAVAEDETRTVGDEPEDDESVPFGSRLVTD
jgi:CBS-domain-containing membrane protein